MKSLTLALAVLTLVSLADPGLAQQQGTEKKAPAGVATTQPNEDPDLRAIRDNTLTVNGMMFPKLPRDPNAKSSASCCNVGDSRSGDVIRVLQERQPVYPSGKVTYEGTTPYGVPTCWVIKSYNMTVNQALHASYSLTSVPAGYSFVTSSQYQQTYQDLKNFVLNLNILDKYKISIIANLQQFTNNYAAYAQSLSVSHASILLYVELESAGLTHGRSAFDGTVHDTESCCPAEITDPIALKTALTTWVTNTVNALPNHGKGIGIAVKPVDQKNL